MVYRSEDREETAEALVAFIAKWKTPYPRVAQSLADNQYLLTFSDFSASIWPSIYLMNLIDSFNKEIKKYSRCKAQFSIEEASWIRDK
ncbi:hypothetical protein B0X71_18790 (plasmid) [Planococcus lenghuensis]|uniref:Mutator family transposase n=1 Tax=Planococcus lenghuensis TaxID=2213202 RepID=A0A1Q2L486_9BACL|nr:hypothetical protein B0X71_18790 [Planococcus lenghuensis]